MFDHTETLEQARQLNISDALREDIGQHDSTAELVREAAVRCGRDWFEGCIRALEPAARLTWHYKEGAAMGAETPVCQIEAKARALLSAERPALNFLQL